MGTFKTIARLWPSGTELDFGGDSNDVSSEVWFTRNAPQFETSDGHNSFQFLFWNTGRRITSKRRVRWHFYILGWSTWTATRWYGIPGPGGQHVDRVRADGFSVGGDMPFADTPINSSGSTFTPASSYPFNGDDHAIGTAGGPVTVAAKDPFHSLDFKGWMQLMWGGDPVGEFDETDENTSSPGTSGSGIYETISGSTYLAAQHSQVDLIASYAHDVSPPLKFDWTKLLAGLTTAVTKPGPVNPGDFLTPDVLRAQIIQELIRQTQPGTPATRGGADFQGVMERIPNMSDEELKRSLQDVQTSVNLGNSAISALQTKLKR